MILCDTGPLVAAAVRNDAHHRRCTDLFTGLGLAGRRLLVPVIVVAEGGYLLEKRVGPALEAAFLEAVGAGDFEPVAVEPADFARMADLVRHYGESTARHHGCVRHRRCRAPRDRRDRNRRSSAFPGRAPTTRGRVHAPSRAGLMRTWRAPAAARPDRGATRRAE